MVFASPFFLFAFLPVFLGAYYTLPKTWRSGLLLVASYAFYGWWRLEYLGVLAGISLVAYLGGRAAIHGRANAVKVSVGLILLILGYFKYTHFFLSNFGYSTIEIILPIGISFLSFQAISYVIDVSRGDAPPARNAWDFLAFTALFPQLIAGPVLRYKDLAHQFEEREHSIQIFTRGVTRFCLGLAMKVLIADTVAPLADRAFALTDPSAAEAWLGALAYTIQLFFDFAGYSAMAIGLGLMIGFKFVENFNFPYVSRSITEFWRRWHISLSNWLRDYLYIPLGGNRLGTGRTYLNLWLTMVLGGLWHGAGWTFVLWGVWHGTLLAIERLFGVKADKGHSWAFTMVLVVIGWVLFRAENLSNAGAMYAGMLGFNGWAASSSFLYATQSIELWALALGGLLSVFGPRLKVLAQTFAPLILFALSCLILLARAHSPFLYFQF